MSMRVTQPIGQKRLTNVAVVRFKKFGKRFEIACYKNKVLNWRNGIEKDLDEVLQTTRVFSNVSKGVLAKQEDLQNVFGTLDEVAICIKILAEGELQVSDKERKVEYEALFRDVACSLSDKCVNPQTNRPYTISMIERALRDVHFAVDLNRSAKQQALEALKLLEAKFPITRARMRLKVVTGLEGSSQIMELLERSDAVVEATEWNTTTTGRQQVVVHCQIDPGLFRTVHTLVSGSGRGSDVVAGRVEVLSLTVAAHDAPLEALPPDATPDLDPSCVPPPSSTAHHGTALDNRAEQGSSISVGIISRAPPSSAQYRSSDVVSSSWTVVYARGPISGIPDQHESRRQRFSEIDDLQSGWQVELRCKEGGGVVDAVFYSPGGVCVGSYANARRAALKACKEGMSTTEGARQLSSELKSLAV